MNTNITDEPIIGLEDIVVSLFKNYKSKIPFGEVNIWEWLRDGSRKADIEYLRNIDDKASRDIIKATLPCITASGLFSERKVDGLVQHSGLICIDIDSKDNPHIEDFNELKNELRKVVNVAFCGLSASGKGVYCLIPIEHNDRHKQHFETLKIAFKHFNINIDKSCGDVSRLRGYSYDPDAYFNMDATNYSVFFEFDENRLPCTSITSNFEDSQDSTRKQVLKVIDNIITTCTDITDSYPQWFQIACAFANEFEEDGREMFHSVSQFNEKYSAAKCNSLYSQCLQNSYAFKIGTFFHWASEYKMI